MKHSRRDGYSIQMRFNLIFLIIAILCLLSINVKAEVPHEANVKTIRIEAGVEKVVAVKDLSLKEALELVDEKGNTVDITDVEPGKKYFIRSNLDGVFIKFDHPQVRKKIKLSKTLKLRSIAYGEKLPSGITAADNYYVLEVDKAANGQEAFMHMNYAQKVYGSGTDHNIYTFKMDFKTKLQSRLWIVPEKQEYPIDMMTYRPAKVDYVIKQNYDIPLKTVAFQLRTNRGKEKFKFNIDFAKMCPDFETKGVCRVELDKKLMIQGTVTFTKKGKNVVAHIEARPAEHGSNVVKQGGVKKIKYQKEVFKEHITKEGLIFDYQLIATNDLGVVDEANLKLNHDSDNFVIDGDPNNAEGEGGDHDYCLAGVEGGDLYWMLQLDAKLKGTARVKATVRRINEQVSASILGEHEVEMGLSILNNYMRPLKRGLDAYMIMDGEHIKKLSDIAIGHLMHKGGKVKRGTFLDRVTGRAYYNGGFFFIYNGGRIYEYYAGYTKGMKGLQVVQTRIAYRAPIVNNQFRLQYIGTTNFKMQQEFDARNNTMYGRKFGNGIIKYEYVRG